MTQPVMSSSHLACFDPTSPGPSECGYAAPACSKAADDDTGAHPADRAAGAGAPEPFGLSFCREADTVVEGFLCDERVVVSDACRKPTNAFDAYICDEPRMRSLQKKWTQTVLSLLKELLFHLPGR